MPPPTSSYSIPTKILCPLDFSPSSEAALEMATNLAQHFHAELSLLHVVALLSSATGNAFFPGPTFVQKAGNHAEKRLAACVADIVGKGLQASSHIEIGNDVVGNILMVIEREQIDMVVISTHGLSGWRSMVFGSVAEKVIKLVPCPLLLLRSVSATVTA